MNPSCKIVRLTLGKASCAGAHRSRRRPMARRVIVLAALFCAAHANLTPASGQTPADGRIVRVVYQVSAKGTWGFHLAHMKDGRYCVHFGNPGRLTLAHMDRAAN